MKYIDSCIESILSQSFSAYELILINDGSTDNSGKRCDAYAKADSRIHVIHQKNQGLSGARNAGLEYATGEYIFFLDSDDSLKQGALKRVYTVMEKSKADVVVCGFEKFFEGKKPTTQAIKRVPIEKSGRSATLDIVNHGQSQMIVAWGKLYRRELWKTLRFPVGRIHEDEFTTYKIFYQCHKVVVLREPWINYLQRPTSLTGSYSIKRLDKLVALKEAIGWFRRWEDNELEIYSTYRFLLNLQIAQYQLRYGTDKTYPYERKIRSSYKKAYQLFSDKKALSLIRRGQLWLYRYFPTVYLSSVHVAVDLYNKLDACRKERS